MIAPPTTLGGPCPTCKGTGKDPRKRKRKCPEIDQGRCVHGRQVVCDNCLHPFPCHGMGPDLLCGQTCSRRRAPRIERPVNLNPKPPGKIVFPFIGGTSVGIEEIVLANAQHAKDVKAE